MKDITYFSIPFYLICIALELIISSVKKVKTHDKKDSIASITVGVISLLFSAVGKLLSLKLFTIIGSVAIFKWDTTKWYYWVFLLLAVDLSYYLFHLGAHHIRFLWASHVTHHSSKEYNLSTAVRQSWTSPFFKPFLYLWIPLLGGQATDILAMISINMLYQFWIHTKLIDRLGPLEWIMNTPSHHRVHHGVNPQYLDKNMAGMFIIWDKMFGTFAKEDEPVRYGILRNIDSYNPVYIAFHEWYDIFKELFSFKSAKAFVKRLT